MAQNQHNNPGNFANDRERAAEAGKTGGQHSGAERHEQQRSASGQQKDQHGSGNFADDRERASEAGRKGGSR